MHKYHADVCSKSPDGLFYMAAEVDKRIAVLEKALLPFAKAALSADSCVAVSGFSAPMDRRDLFMWAANRPLCVADFNAAHAAISE